MANNNTVANSEAVGVGLVTTKAGQVVIGKYNATSDADIVIGCGTDDVNRKNALTIKDGVISSDSITESTNVETLNAYFSSIPAKDYVEDFITIGRGTGYTYAAYIPMGDDTVYEKMTSGGKITRLAGTYRRNQAGYSAQTFQVGVGMVNGSTLALEDVNYFTSSYGTSDSWATQDFTSLVPPAIPAKSGNYDMAGQVYYLNNSSAALDIKVWRYTGSLEEMTGTPLGYVLLYDGNKQVQSYFIGGFVGAKFVGNTNADIVTPQVVVHTEKPETYLGAADNGAFYLDRNSEIGTVLYTRANSSWNRVTPKVTFGSLPTSSTTLTRSGDIWVKETATAGTYDVVIGMYNSSYNQVFLKLSGTVYTPTEETPTVTTTAATPTEETNG